MYSKNQRKEILRFFFKEKISKARRIGESKGKRSFLRQAAFEEQRRIRNFIKENPTKRNHSFLFRRENFEGKAHRRKQGDGLLT